MGVHQSEIGLESIRGQNWSGKDVLDVGCGSGKLTYEVLIATNAKRIVGVDIEESKVDKAKKLAETKRENRLEFTKADASDLAIFPEGSFDIVFSNIAFQQFSDKLTSLKEMYRALREGGGVFINFIEEKSDVRKEMELIISQSPFNKLVKITKGKKITKDEFNQLSQRVGFMIILSKSVFHAHFYATVDEMLNDYQRFEVVFPSLRELSQEQVGSLWNQLRNYFLGKKGKRGFSETWKVVQAHLAK